MRRRDGETITYFPTTTTHMPYTIFFKPIKSFIQLSDGAGKALNRLGLSTLRDLLFYQPTSYNRINIGPDLARVKQGDLIQTEVVLEDVLQPSSRRAPLKMQVANETGSLALVFFNKIHPFIYSRLRVGQKYIIAGKVDIFDHMAQISHPEFIFNKKLAGPLMPVYPLTYGIVNKQLYGYIIDAINLVEKNLVDNKFFGHLDYFAELLAQVKALHYVGSDAHNRDNILQKLAERELFANQASLAKIRSQEHKRRGRSFCVESEDCHGHNITLAMTGDILRKLGFELTQGQKEVISEIEHDQASEFQMMRLLQGDVGSGKTLVALLTMLNVVNSGAQSALMVPTDLLSLQHYQFFCQALEGMNVRVELLTGKTTAKQKKQIQTDLLEGSIDILIGTHALFQEKVEFKDLGYIIIDEQHRFGVEQRLELIKKASNPDVLVMTATPIPRSLTLTMFGDMDVSQLKTKPRNRLPIITTIISNEKKREVIESLGKKLQTGEKIYWVCPLVDEKDTTLEGAGDEVIPLSNVTGRFLELENIYSGQVSMIHGKLKGDLKDQIMQEFKESNKSILVATTVIEVGIDVPQASLIIIENAEKFGLAQLHQLRGRVGRGATQSHCLLMYNPKRLSTLGRQRLKIMRESNDGFYIAEQDLILRGGGEILGTKQSGEPEFFFADLARDLKILLAVNQQVKTLRHDGFIDFQIDLFARNKRELVRGG